MNDLLNGVYIAEQLTDASLSRHAVPKGAILPGDRGSRLLRYCNGMLNMDLHRHSATQAFPLLTIRPEKLKLLSNISDAKMSWMEEAECNFNIGARMMSGTSKLLGMCER